MSLNLFLKYFISENKSVINSPNVFDIELLNYNDVEIRREWKNIDILIIIREPEKKIVICIENKIKSPEHSNQLQKYREIVEKDFQGYERLFVFLTPESTIPSDENWVNYNYSTVADLIENLTTIKKDLLNENIISFIEHYNIILIDQLILVKAGDNEVTYITNNGINLLQTFNKSFFRYNYEWARNIIQKSTLISGSAEKERKKYFIQLNEKIQKVITQIG